MTVHAALYAGQVYTGRNREEDLPSLVADLRTGLRLINHLGGATEDATFFLHRDVELPEGEPGRRGATLEHLRQWATQLASKVAPGDRLIFIVSNHFDIDTASLLVDATFDPLDDRGDEERQPIPLETFAALLGMIDCEQVLVVSTCGAGLFVNALAEPEKRLVFAACDAVHSLYWNGDPPRIVEHDAFVDALVAGATVDEAYAASLRAATHCRPAGTPLMDGSVSFLR